MDIAAIKPKTLEIIPHSIEYYLTEKKLPKWKLFIMLMLGTPEGIRTPDLWYRKPTLYPAELRVHTPLFGDSIQHTR